MPPGTLQHKAVWVKMHLGFKLQSQINTLCTQIGPVQFQNGSESEPKGTIFGARTGSEDEARSGHDFGRPRVRFGSVLGSILEAIWPPFRGPFSVVFLGAVWGRFGISNWRSSGLSRWVGGMGGGALAPIGSFR